MLFSWSLDHNASGYDSDPYSVASEPAFISFYTQKNVVCFNSEDGRGVSAL